MTEAVGRRVGFDGHAFCVVRGFPLLDGCSCGWSGDVWADHVLGLMLDVPLEYVSVEG